MWKVMSSSYHTQWKTFIEASSINDKHTCCSWTSSADELFLVKNVSVFICSWTVCHVTWPVCFPLLHLWLLLCANNKCCWKLKTSDMLSVSIQTFSTHCLCSYIAFSCSHHKQLNGNLKGIFLVMLAVYEQVALMSSS